MSNAAHASQNDVIRVEIQNDFIEVRTAIDQLLSGLSSYTLSEEDEGTLQIVLAEVLNNVVEHAYADGAEHGPIEVECRVGENELELRVLDDGFPMPNAQVPVGKSHNLDVDLMELPEGGFGWFMIQTLTRDVKYFRSAGRNVLQFWLPIGADNGTA
jgi:serine/threonine-protein kinase RsbW